MNEVQWFKLYPLYLNHKLLPFLELSSKIQILIYSHYVNHVQWFKCCFPYLNQVHGVKYYFNFWIMLSYSNSSPFWVSQYSNTKLLCLFESCLMIQMLPPEFESNSFIHILLILFESCSMYEVQSVNLFILLFDSCSIIQILRLLFESH